MRTLAALFILMLLAPACQAKDYPRSEWSSSRDLKASKVTKARVLTNVLQFGLMALDYETSQAHFSQGGYEVMPWFGSRRPTRRRMYAIGLPLNVAAAIGGRKFQIGAALIHGGGLGMTLRF